MGIVGSLHRKKDMCCWIACMIMSLISYLTSSSSSSCGSVSKVVVDLRGLEEPIGNDLYSVWVTRRGAWYEVTSVSVAKAMKTGACAVTELTCELCDCEGKAAGTVKIDKVHLSASNYGPGVGKLWAVYEVDWMLRFAPWAAASSAGTSRKKL